MSNLVEIGPVFLKEGFLNIFNIILLFRFFLPFVKGVALHSNKLEFPPRKSDLCQVWLKVAQSYLSPLGKGWGTSFEQS